MPRGLDDPRSMNDNTGDLAISGRIADVWDGQVNQRALLLRQAVQLSSRLMAQHRVGPGPQEHGPELRLAPKVTREGRVYAALNALPVREPYAVAHLLPREPEFGALGT